MDRLVLLWKECLEGEDAAKAGRANPRAVALVENATADVAEARTVLTSALENCISISIQLLQLEL
jgi:hypothetical protein